MTSIISHPKLINKHNKKHSNYNLSNKHINLVNMIDLIVQEAYKLMILCHLINNNNLKNLHIIKNQAL